jgi:hypothetical protein
MLDYTTPKHMRYKSLSSWKYDMMVHLVPYKPLEAFKVELAHTKYGDWHDVNTQDHSLELVQQVHICKAQVCAICDDNQCRKFTRGDRFNGG